MLNLPLIFLLVVIEIIVDYIIFRLFEIRRVTLIVTILMNFLIPVINIWLIAQSDMPFAEQILVVTDIFVAYIMNLLNFIIASAIGIIISVLICSVAGRERLY